MFFLFFLFLLLDRLSYCSRKIYCDWINCLCSNRGIGFKDDLEIEFLLRGNSISLDDL